MQAGQPESGREASARVSRHGKAVSVISACFELCVSVLLTSAPLLAQTSPPSSVSPDEIIKLAERLKSSNNKRADDASNALVDLSAVSLEPVVSALTNILADQQHPFAQEKAAYTIARIEWGTDDTLNKLSRLIDQGLQNPKPHKGDDPDGPAVAAWALGSIGYAPGDTIPILIQALRQTNYPHLNETAAYALGALGGDWETAGPYLVDALKDGNTNVSVRKAAAAAISKLGLGAKLAISDLVDVAVDPANKRPVQDAALRSLADISTAFRNSSDLAVRTKLKEAEKRLGSPSAGHESVPQRAVIYAIDQTVASIEQHSILFDVINHPTRWIFLLALALYFIWVILLWTYIIHQRPFAIFTLYGFLIRRLNIALPKSWFGGVEITLPQFILAGSAHHADVLDAWVRRHADRMSAAIDEQRKAAGRTKYEPLPVQVNGKMVSDLTLQTLTDICKREQWTVAILGEGGIGKTTLAYELALWALRPDNNQSLCSTHRMLPVIIDPEDGVTALANADALKATILWRLQTILQTRDRLPESFCDELLRERRILVVLDGLSETISSSRTQIAPADRAFVFNALICTSRTHVPLTRDAQCIIQPQRIQKDKLRQFLDSYLHDSSQLGLEELPPDARRPIELFANKNLKPLFVKLYAKYLIHTATAGSRQHIGSVPKLITEYLSTLDSGGTKSNPTLQKVAEICAWACMQENFFPAPVSKEAVLQAVKSINHGAHALARLESLKVIETLVAAPDQIQFVDDPIAEYLAALHLLNSDEAEQHWQKVHLVYRAMPNAHSIDGFLNAAFECAADRDSTASLPAWVLARLSAGTQAVSQTAGAGY